MYAAFKTAVAQDWEYEANFKEIDIGVVFDSWVQNAGSPVVTVTRNSETGVMNVTQVSIVFFFCGCLFNRFKLKVVRQYDARARFFFCRSPNQFEFTRCIATPSL